MIPDRGFVKQLHAIDKSLEVVWDWGAEKWEIWHFPDDGRKPYCLTVVQTKGRSYRELGADVLLKLQQHIQMGPEKVLKYLEESEAQIQRRKRKDLHNLIDSIARDTFINIHCKIIQVPQKFKIAEAVKNG